MRSLPNELTALSWRSQIYSTLKQVEKGFENCLIGEDKIRARYKWTRPDGKMVVEVKSMYDTKVRQIFDASEVELYPEVKIVQK